MQSDKPEENDEFDENQSDEDAAGSGSNIFYKLKK